VQGSVFSCLGLLRALTESPRGRLLLFVPELVMKTSERRQGEGGVPVYPPPSRKKSRRRPGPATITSSSAKRASRMSLRLGLDKRAGGIYSSFLSNGYGRRSRLVAISSSAQFGQ
jgi:hypothetical protein